MKIIQIIPSFELAGAEIMCENLIYALTNLGHQVIAVSMYDYRTAITERLESRKVKIHYLGKKPGLDLSMFKKINKILKEEAPDVVHTHLYVTKYIFPVAKKLNIKVVHTFHTVAKEENTKLTRILNKIYFWDRSAVPVALSEKVQSTIIEEYGFKNSFIPVIFNGIDLENCQIKKDYSYNENFKILHIGRFQDVKNHRDLVKAFSIFNQKHPNSQLYLIGDGELRHEIENLTDQIGIKSAVTFFGLQSDVHKYISDMDVFALPSKYEGVPMTLIEAMGTGMPIVATAVGGVPDMLDENSAQLVPVDTVAIADAFEKYYFNYELRKLHGENALKLAERFSSVTMAKRYVEIYEGRRP
ncbi:MAG: glycosyltransferase [Clostridia bacterium]|nr:glycosyltransferase [Clostridia bacterium]